MAELWLGFSGLVLVRCGLAELWLGFSTLVVAELWLGFSTLVRCGGVVAWF